MPLPPEPQPPPHPPATVNPSPLKRTALLAYVFLIIYASWYPFSGWHNNGISPLTFLEHTALPRYWTKFDVGINILGYIPLGMLIVYWLYPRIKGVSAILLTGAFGVLMSGTMEAVQTYLPSRVSSNLDFYTNSAGCALGAILGALSARQLLNHSHLQRLRRGWFNHRAGAGLVLLTLWPLSHIYPQAYLFGLGQVLPLASEWLSSLLDLDLDLGAYLRPAALLTVEQYWLSETLITACGMTGAALTLLCLLRPAAPKAMLLIGLIGAGLLIKTLASALLFAPDNALVWITPGAEGGVLIGLIMLGGLVFAPPLVQQRLAVLTLLLSLAIVNAIPINPYFASTLQGWVQGKFLNFNGAAQFLSLLWPFFAIGFLLRPWHTPKQKI